MGQLGHARSFRELVVYQKARLVSRMVFDATKSFPKEEMYSLTDQVRRSSRSIGAQIAEAWAKRRYEKHFVSKLTDADAEQQETYHWTDIALECGYLEDRQAARIFSECSEIGRMLNAMAVKAHAFCRIGPSSVRESAAEYFISDE